MIEIFKDLTANEHNYCSIFENDTLAWLKGIHDHYSSTVVCYCFYKKEDFDLSRCTGAFINEFIENSSWLKFGFHAYDSDTLYPGKRALVDDYRITINELKRIVGCNSVTSVIRLQCFSGDLEGIHELVSCGEIKGLLSADDKRKSYYLSKEESRFIYSHDYYVDDKIGLTFFSTDIRVEMLQNIYKKIKEFESSSWNNQLDVFVFFSHEWALNTKVKKNINILYEYLQNNGYSYSFLEDYADALLCCKK